MVTNKTPFQKPVGKWKRSRIWMQRLIGYAVGGGCLFLIFHKLPLDQVWKALATAHWGFVPLAALLSFGAYLCVAWQWVLFMRPLGKLPYLRSVQAVFAGRFANDTLPVHVGYVVRAFLTSRWMNAPLAAMVSPLVMERLFDGSWLLGGTVLLSFYVPLPPDIIRGRNFLAVAVLGGLAAVAVIVLLRRGRTADAPAADVSLPKQFLARIQSFIQRCAEGMHDILRSWLFPATLAVALLKQACQVAGILVLLPAFQIHLALAPALVVFVAGYLAISVPSLPATTGLFQLFVAGVLVHFGVSKPVAVSYSLVAFVAFTVPLALGGFFAVAQSPMTLHEILEEAQASNDSK